MQIWIHDKDMRKVCVLNNNVPGMILNQHIRFHNS